MECVRNEMRAILVAMVPDIRSARNNTYMATNIYRIDCDRYICRVAIQYNKNQWLEEYIPPRWVVVGAICELLTAELNMKDPGPRE